MYLVITDQFGVCRTVWLVVRLFCSSLLSFVRDLNQGKHSGQPCVMALCSGTVLLKSAVADLSTHLSCCFQMAFIQCKADVDNR